MNMISYCFDSLEKVQGLFSLHVVSAIILLLGENVLEIEKSVMSEK
jgi:hypothetical protein